MRKSINSLEELNNISFEIVKQLKPGDIYLLYGDMGMGKTTFVSYVMSHLNFNDVSSPTYSIVQQYDSSPPVYHIDLYRLEGKSQIDLLDLDYYLDQKDHIIFIEWPDRLDTFNRPAKTLKFSKDDRSIRSIDYNF